MVHYYKGELPKKNTFEGRTFSPFLGKVYKIYLKYLGKMYVIAYFCLGKMYFMSCDNYQIKSAVVLTNDNL